MSPFKSGPESPLLQSPVHETAFQLYGEFPPEAARIALYGTLTVPEGREDVAMLRGGLVVVPPLVELLLAAS